MGFFLTDIVNSAITPGGTNARRKQVEGQQIIGNLGGDIAKGAGADYLSAMKFGRGFDPQLQNALRYLSDSTSTAGLVNQAKAAGRAARAGLISRQVAPSLNPYAAQGIRAGNLNQAQDAENQALNNAFSPQAHAAATQAFMQALAAYKHGYGQDLQLGANLAYGQPAVPVQPGILDYASQIAGIYTGIKNAQKSKTDPNNSND